MIVVLAGDKDAAARSLVARWQAYDAHWITPAGLSVAGWRCYSHSLNPSTCVLSGRVVESREITAVLTRLPCVTEYDLPHIQPPDRAYVAAEMTAFLVWWLGSLDCPVLNPPTPTGLAGPNWRSEQWAHCAAGLGIPVRPVLRTVSRYASSTASEPAVASVKATVVGDRCLGSEDASITSRARRLANAAGASLLEVEFSGPEPDSLFLSANSCPDVSGELADSILEMFRERLHPQSGSRSNR
jgi:hypothetical protein